MARLLLLLPLALGMGACTRFASPAAVETGGRRPPPSAGSPDVASLRAAEEAWASALRRQDYPVLERLLAPEFRLLTQGQVTPRALWFENLRTFRVDSVALFHVEPRVVGDSGSVSLEFYWHGEVDGRAPIDRTGVLLDTWRFREGRWVVVERETLARRPGYSPSPPR